MSKKTIDINKLEDLDKFRSAPKLNKIQSKILLNELSFILRKSDWITVGVMSPSLKKGIHAIRKIEEKFEYEEMKCITIPNSDGPIFLKANQKTGEIHARIEFGLGEGILISCQYNDNLLISKTYGPLPLDFFD
ncbi:DUF1824 family protein [Prochlorococcus marinus]|uniref:DUF1824 family protein n=1 Tax=Prochlorococcus marinus TaxID=1219 RepID=UPI0022B2AE1B|nr:DUF1824 family protein [Prochlorococcus marinus]